jgi:lichenan operon transcriptional antiterminator
MADTTADIVGYVLDKPGTTPADLARRMDVSVRTLRKYVAEANDELGALGEITLQRGKGYRLETADVRAVRSWLSDRRRAGSDLPATSDERVRWLATNLLLRDDWVTLDSLSETLYISRTSVSNDLREVEALFAHHGLSLSRRPGYGIKVMGSEQAKRLCLTHNIGLETSRIFNVIDTDATLPELSFPFTSLITDLVRQATSTDSFHINNAAFENLVAHVIVALVRVLQGNPIELSRAQIGTIAKTTQYEAAEKLARSITEATGIELTEAETAYLAIHFASKEAFLEEQLDTGGSLVIQDDVWSVVGEMVALVSQTYKIDLTDDIELRVNLARHVIPLSVRLRFDMKLENPLLEEIKTNYSLAYQMARDASIVLRRHYGTRPSDDEVGYIALAFALALERRRHERLGKRILFVCASGMAGARLLEYYYKKEFGDYISEISFTDVQHIADVDFSTIDYVFSSVPLPEEVPVPVLRISAVFDAASASNARRFFEGRDAAEEPDAVFSPDLFFESLAVDSESATPPKRQVLDFLCAQVEATGNVPDNFHELVLEREMVISTAMGNRVAIAHPLETGAGVPTGAVALLDEPVVWDRTGNMVQVVFLISFSDLDPDLHSRLIKALTEICTSPACIDELLAKRDWNEFKTLFDRYFE